MIIQQLDMKENSIHILMANFLNKNIQNILFIEFYKKNIFIYKYNYDRIVKKGDFYEKTYYTKGI